MKRIAIIADAWKRYVNYSWILGCKNYIQEQNLDVEIDIFQNWLMECPEAFFLFPRYADPKQECKPFLPASQLSIKTFASRKIRRNSSIGKFLKPSSILFINYFLINKI